MTNLFKTNLLLLLGTVVLVSTTNATTVVPTTFDLIAESEGTTLLRFDDYVSNAQPGRLEVNNNLLLTTPGVFTGFTNPTSAYTTQSMLPDPIGILVESSYGEVNFWDATSYQTTSDILGPWTPGDTLTFTFVSPSNTLDKATVEQVAFRFGSVWSSDAVSVSFFDVDMNEIPVDMLGDEEVPLGLPPGFASSRGWTATEGTGVESMIHKVRFTATNMINGDGWFVGSFYDSSDMADMAFSGFTTLSDNFVFAPLPGAAWMGINMLGVLAINQVIRRRRLSA